MPANIAPRRTVLFLPRLTLAAAAAAALLGLAGLRPLAAGDDPPADDKAEAALKKLAERAADASADRDKLAQDLLDFRLAHPGTPYAARAAALLSRLPSPLDKLDPAAIPALEKFDWQPPELVAVVGEHRGRQAGPVTCVAVSPDGTLVASGGGSLLRLWDAKEMKLQSVVGHYAVASLAFSKDGKALATGGGDGYVRVWDLAEGKPPAARCALPSGASTAVASVAFSSDNKTVAAAVGNGEIHLYDVSSAPGKELHALAAHDGGATAVAFLPDGKGLVSGGADKKLKLWDVADKLEEKATLQMPSDKPAAPSSLTITSDDATLAVGRLDGTIDLWNLPASSKAKPRAVLPDVKAGAVNAVAVSKSQVLAAAYGDGTVRLWGTGGQPVKERHKLEGHYDAATAVAFSPDEKLLFSGGADWMVRSWDLSTKKERFQPDSHTSSANGVAFSPDGKALATASYDRVLRLWDLTKAPIATRKYVIPPQKSDMRPLSLVAYAPDGKLVAVADNSATARVYEAATGKPQSLLAGHPAAVSGLAFGPDSKRILTSSHKTLYLWDAVKGTQLLSFPDHDTPIGCLAFSPDGKYALSGSGGVELDKQGKPVTRDGHYVYTDCVLRLWDAAAGKELDVNKSATTPVGPAAFSPDGRSAYSGVYTEPALHKWDVSKQTLAEGSKFTAAAGYPLAVLPAPDGRAVATRGLDGKIVVWDVETGKKLYEVTAGAENVAGMAYAPDGRHLAVGLTTGVTYIVRLAPPEK
jgi:WD40 repeat protein